jgi:hypothetical protein
LNATLAKSISQSYSASANKSTENAECDAVWRRPEADLDRRCLDAQHTSIRQPVERSLDRPAHPVVLLHNRNMRLAGWFFSQLSG